MKPIKKHPRKHAILTVETFGGEKVFVLGKLRIDQLSPYNLLPKGTRSWSASIRVYRHNKLFDNGRIKEYGTHAASHCFFGLTKFNAIKRDSSGVVVYGNLLALWFDEEDEFRLSITTRELRENILSNWRAQVEKLPKYARKVTRADKLLDKLLIEGGGLNSTKAGIRALNRASRVAFREVDAQVRKEPVPKVIHWKYPYS